MTQDLLYWFGHHPFVFWYTVIAGFGETAGVFDVAFRAARAWHRARKNAPRRST